MNRWKYDPDRLIPITCMDPQRSRKYDKQVQNTEGTTTQEFYTDSYGAAHGARVTDDTGALRSIRNMGKNKNEKAADSPSTSAPDVTGVKTGGTNKKKKNDAVAKTTEPKWTRKLRDALTKAVEHNTNARGISWVCVVNDMNITKHYCRKEWTRILQERKATEAPPSSSSAESSMDEDDSVDDVPISFASSKKANNAKVTSHKSELAPVITHLPSSKDVVDSGAHSELIKLMRAQTSKLEEISANQTRLENENKNLKQLAAKAQSQLLDMQSKLQENSSSTFHGNASASSDECEGSNYSSSDRNRKRSSKRPRYHKKKREKRGRGSGIDEDSVIMIQNAVRQAERVCSLTVENDRLRFMNLKK